MTTTPEGIQVTSDNAQQLGYVLRNVRNSDGTRSVQYVPNQGRGALGIHQTNTFAQAHPEIARQESLGNYSLSSDKKPATEQSTSFYYPSGYAYLGNQNFIPQANNGFSYFETGKTTATGQSLIGSAAGNITIKEGNKNQGISAVTFSQGKTNSYQINLPSYSNNTSSALSPSSNISVPISSGVAAKLQNQPSYFFNPQNKYYATITNPLNNPIQFQKGINDRKMLDVYSNSSKPWGINLSNNPIQFGLGATAAGFNFIENMGISLGKGTYKLASTTPGAIAYNLPYPLRAGIKPINPSNTLSNPDVQNLGIAAGYTLASEIPIGKAIIETGFGYYGAKNIGIGLLNNNPKNVGEGVVMVGLSNPMSNLARIKRPFIEVFGEKVKPEDVFSTDVSAKSVPESLSQFNKGKVPGGFEITTVSPGFLKGDIKAGPKGAAGIEDPVGYFAPKGRGNTMFTGLPGYGASSELSFNPLDMFKNQEPTANTFVVQDIQRIPKSVLKTPGFANPKITDFYSSNLDNGIAFVTKRSEIGKGGIGRQMFTPLTDINLRSKSFKVGNYYLEAGTSESEVGLYRGTKYQRVDNGLSQKFRFTILNQKSIFGTDIPLTGQLVRLPKYEVLSSNFEKIGFNNDNLFKSEKNSGGYENFSSRPAAKISVRYSLFSSNKAFSSSRVSKVNSSLSVGSSSLASSSSSFLSSFQPSKSSGSSLARSFSSLSSNSSSNVSRNISSQSSFSSSLRSSSVSSRSISSSISNPSIKTPPSLFSFNLGLNKDNRAKRSFGVQKETKYTPSFTALVFNIHGKYQAGKLANSGLNFRPITKGFNFSNKGVKRQVRFAA